MAQRRKIKNAKIKFSLVLLAAFVLSVIFRFYFSYTLTHDISFVVNRGDSVSAVATRLARAGAIDSQSMFKTMIRINGGRIQAGEYDIRARTGVWRIARMLSHGDVATTTVVVPEGLTIRQIKELLLQSAALTGAVECDAGNNAPVCNLHDGDVFPDTYRVARGTSRLAFLELMRKKMDSVHQSWMRGGARAPVPLRGWNDVVTLASIVQKETPRESEMPVVASVYLNRLRKNMRLQADPTVVYALTNGYGDMRGAPLLRGHLQTESPYNTYRNSGLPPAPIANVGQAALKAVLKPANTNYLFFVADGRGGHKFTDTYEQHMRNHTAWREIKKIRAAQ